MIPEETDEHRQYWMRKYDELCALREGDSKLIRALAEDAGINITASDKLPGKQWEQFHDGVMALAKENEGLKEQLEQIKEIANLR